VRRGFARDSPRWPRHDLLHAEAQQERLAGIQVLHLADRDGGVREVTDANAVDGLIARPDTTVTASCWNATRSAGAAFLFVAFLLKMPWELNISSHIVGRRHTIGDWKFRPLELPLLLHHNGVKQSNYQRSLYNISFFVPLLS
jgi:hypothetical protein